MKHVKLGFVLGRVCNKYMLVVMLLILAKLSSLMNRELISELKFTHENILLVFYRNKLEGHIWKNSEM